MKRLLYFLFALIGFGTTSCEETIDDVAEYGCPNINFSLKARVVDEAGNPISGIEVQTRDHDFYRDNISDAEGNIDCNASMWPYDKFEIVFTDIDGEANGGEFETLKLDITEQVKQIEDGSGSWYEGGFKAELGDVEMTLKTKNEE